MPLVRGAAAVSASTFLAETAKAGRAAFAAFFAPLDAESARQLAGILEAVAAADGGGSGGIAPPRPTKGALPATLQNADLATILYIDSAYNLFFQSQLHARTWAHVRGQYTQMRGKRAVLGPRRLSLGRHTARSRRQLP